MCTLVKQKKMISQVSLWLFLLLLVAGCANQVARSTIVVPRNASTPIVSSSVSIID